MGFLLDANRLHLAQRAHQHNPLDLLVFYTGEALRSMLETCRAEYNRRPRGPPTRLLMPGDAVSIAESAGQCPHLTDTTVTCQ
jgi:hypothetical protein